MTIEQNSFKKIIRAERMTKVLEENKNNLGEIVVMEKIDGANASFRLGENGELRYFSRRRELFVGEDSLNGFVQWVNKNVDTSKLEKDKVYFGEWTTPHKLSYGDNHKKFFLFDVYDTTKEEYIDINQLLHISTKLDIPHAPILYVGDFQNMNHLESMVGTSYLGETGEGIVIKFKDFKYRSSQLYLKMVSEHFSEIKRTKSKKLETLDDLVSSTNTVARADKMIRKMVDEGELSQEELTIENMGKILKVVCKEIVVDILEEELATFETAITKKLSKQVPLSVKKAILEIENIF